MIQFLVQAVLLLLQIDGGSQVHRVSFHDNLSDKLRTVYRFLYVRKRLLQLQWLKSYNFPRIYPSTHALRRFQFVLVQSGTCLNAFQLLESCLQLALNIDSYFQKRCVVTIYNALSFLQSFQA